MDKEIKQLLIDYGIIMEKEIKEILKEVSELLSEQGHFKLIDLERVRKLNSKIEELLR